MDLTKFGKDEKLGAVAGGGATLMGATVSGFLAGFLGGLGATVVGVVGGVLVGVTAAKLMKEVKF